MNQISLTGNVTKDLELKQSKENSILYTQFTLAVDHHIKGKKTEFIDIVAFGAKAEILAKYLVKGSKLYLTGRLERSSYVNRDGVNISRDKVILEDFEFLGGPRDKRSEKVEEAMEASLI